MKIVAKTLIVNSKDQYLVLIRSSTHPHFALHYDFPGGVVEQNEDITTAAAREIMEEIGLEVEPSDLQLVFEYNVEKNVMHVLFELRLQTDSPAILLSWEHNDYEWMRAEKLVNLAMPNNVDVYYSDVINWLKS